MSLREYRKKRDFTRTPEPAGVAAAAAAAGRSARTRRFVIQKHAASRLHFDFRLELGRKLVSWAVPKGLPMAHGEKRLAVRVEDHPRSYFDFEGTIPKGEYGGGTVQVWDWGTFEPLSPHPLKELKGGKLHFILHGEKLSGEWFLVAMRQENQWLIIRGGDDHRRLTRPEAERSVLSGRTMAEIAREGEAGTRPGTRLKPEEMTFIEPMKARLVEAPPEGEWFYELKFDGFRALACKEGNATGLISRTRNDLGVAFPEIADALARVHARGVVMDGEIVALDAQGRSSFQLLQGYQLGEVRPPLCYYAFDLLIWNGKNLTRWPIDKRKAKLRALLPADDAQLRFSASLGGDAAALLAKASELHLEGIIGKRAGSHYEPGRRSGAWIKLKLLREQEFVIGGYTDPEGSRPCFGALLVGYFEGKTLRYAGKVGTGFTEAMLRDLHGRFGALARPDCPFPELPEKRAGRYGQGITAAAMKRCHWLRPGLVAQVRFGQWTRDDRLRQPVFLGLREDKAAREVVRETPQ